MNVYIATVERSEGGGDISGGIAGVHAKNGHSVATEDMGTEDNVPVVE